MHLKRLSNGETIQLGKELGSGGEGKIYEVIQDSSLVAKIYHQYQPEYAEKLKVMVANPPIDPSALKNHVSIAWPIDLLQDLSQKVIGFLMPRVTGMRPIHDYYTPKTRRQNIPGFNYLYLHRSARNLATAFNALHNRGYVIGDVNESNILVSQTALVTLVDTDSFQVRNPNNNVVYRCGVGKSEFTPPELQGQNFRSSDREVEHDLFGLAVLIFQLLMEGTHPFDGVYKGTGEPPSKEARIAGGGFPYGNKIVPYHPKPLAPAFGVIHPFIQELFITCFEEGHLKPKMRPTAQLWKEVLEYAENILLTCETNQQHLYGRHLNDCPWCQRSILLKGQDPFPFIKSLKPDSYSPPKPSIINARPPIQPKLLKFSFEVLKVTKVSRGFFNLGSKLDFNRRSGQAQYFAEDLGKGVTLYMVAIPGGEFIMGSLESEKGSNKNERPQHQVKIQSFFMSKYPITQAQWKAIALLPKIERNLKPEPSKFKGNYLPVETVSWYDAVEFCARLSQKTGLIYRLSSEAEREYACRAGTTTPFHFGETITTDLANYNRSLTYASEPQGEYRDKTTAVGSFPPNAFGLYDMHGLVWEWCADPWHDYYEGAPTDGRVWDKKNNNENYYQNISTNLEALLKDERSRILRGGSWFNYPRYCRSASRGSFNPDFDNYFIGFRVVCGVARTQ